LLGEDEGEIDVDGDTEGDADAEGLFTWYAEVEGVKLVVQRATPFEILNSSIQPLNQRVSPG
jgi:hypothetical protein